MSATEKTAKRLNSRVTEKYSQRGKKKRESSSRISAVDLTSNKIYDILEDSTIPFDARMEKIVEALTINLESEETVSQSQENVQLVKDIVKELLSRFTDHNRKSIEFTRDNPLGKLKESIQEVFDNYHKISTGRADLKGKLSTVDQLIEQVGGEEKLVLALVEAKTRNNERSTKETEVAAAEEKLRKAQFELHRISDDIEDNKDAIFREEDKFLASVRPGVKATISSLKKENAELKSQQDEAKYAVNKAKEEHETVTSELTKLINSEDFKVHEQITRILDIASPEFKEQLTELAEATLQYIDDTQNVMSQVRDQLEHLLKDVDGGLDVNVNIREQVSILSGALQRANDVSAQKLSDFKKTTKSEEMSDLERLEKDKIARFGDIFVSETSSTMASVTMISSEVQKVEIVLLSLRDQLTDGLSDADEQLLMAVNTASASGMVMLNRAQTLGTLAQAVISRGQYMNEAEETFGQLAQEFERSLAVKAGRNDTISALSSVISDITAAMDERNDAATNIAIERRELLTDLIDKVDDLRKIAEETREIDSRVNEELAKAS